MMNFTAVRRMLKRELPGIVMRRGAGYYYFTGTATDRHGATVFGLALPSLYVYSMNQFDSNDHAVIYVRMHLGLKA